MASFCNEGVGQWSAGIVRMPPKLRVEGDSVIPAGD